MGWEEKTMKDSKFSHAQKAFILKQGDRKIDEREADVVRRIFRMFADGVAPRAIARTLNEDGIPGPGGKPWVDTTIRGHMKRGTGIVNNELYIGRLI